MTAVVGDERVRSTIQSGHLDPRSFEIALAGEVATTRCCSRRGRREEGAAPKFVK
jgi:hypothetical protein